MCELSELGSLLAFLTGMPQNVRRFSARTHHVLVCEALSILISLPLEVKSMTEMGFKGYSEVTGRIKAGVKGGL